jgi:transitional endoplasmic reticulum ATPase
MRTVEFKVIETDSAEHCIVSKTKRQTRLMDNIGGYYKQVAQICELKELPYCHPQLFKLIGIKPPHGIMLFCPPDTDYTNKTHMVHIVTNNMEGS